MNRRNIFKRVATITALAAVAALPWTNPAAADEDDYYGQPRWEYGYGMGPGMMGGYGGYGMGPGMMGGYGGYGMGPGTMGGYGMGPGMMGGYGMGPGMMGSYGGVGALELSDAQREQINKIADGERKRHWNVMGQMLDEQNKLRDLFAQDTPDPKKVGAAYGELAKLQQQMIEAHVRAQNQIQNVLTKEQREQLQQWRRGGWAPGAGPRGGYGPGAGPGYGPRGGMMGR